MKRFIFYKLYYSILLSIYNTALPSILQNLSLFYVCECMCTMYKSGACRDAECPGTGVTDTCELPSGAKN